MLSTSAEIVSQSDHSNNSGVDCHQVVTLVCFTGLTAPQPIYSELTVCESCHAAVSGNLIPVKIPNTFIAAVTALAKMGADNCCTMLLMFLRLMHSLCHNRIVSCS